MVEHAIRRRASEDGRERGDGIALVRSAEALTRELVRIGKLTGLAVQGHVVEHDRLDQQVHRIRAREAGRLDRAIGSEVPDLLAEPAGRVGLERDRATLRAVYE